MSAAVTTPPAIAETSAPLDHRGSWIPTGHMIRTRMMELRKRRGLMIMLLGVYVGLPALFFIVRLILHAVDPKTYGAAGGYSTFGSATVLVLYFFGFIVAATLGCTAGSVDLTEGMFRHTVITGRSRLALYFARIPAGLAIVLPIVLAGFIVVCSVCVFAAPTKLEYNGVTVPVGLTKVGFEQWAANNSEAVVCNFPFDNININPPCFNGPGSKFITNGGGPATPPPVSTAAQIHAAAIVIATQDFVDYHQQFLSPPFELMVRSGLWVLLEATIGFMVGLGLASLIGQRTLAVILMVVLEIILTPILTHTVIAHFINVQRGIIGLAMAHLEPSALPRLLGGGNGPNSGSALIPETHLVASLVIAGWIVVWTALGAWRMATREC